MDFQCNYGHPHTEMLSVENEMRKHFIKSQSKAVCYAMYFFISTHFVGISFICQKEIPILWPKMKGLKTQRIKSVPIPTLTPQDKHIQESLLRTGTTGVILGAFLTHATCNWSAHLRPPSSSTAGTILHAGITSCLSPHVWLSSIQRFSTEDQNSPLQTKSDRATP